VQLNVVGGLTLQESDPVITADAQETGTGQFVKGNPLSYGVISG